MAAGVRYVTGYPGSPSTATVEALTRLADPTARIEWAINEKSAFDSAFGASLAGARTLLCLKSVGLNVALDSLMVGNLAGGAGGFVILAGDDPGGWGSQNEQDSRLLAAAAEVPLLEPTSAAEASGIMPRAYDLSEEFNVPVVVRITRALSDDTTGDQGPRFPSPSHQAVEFRRQGDRYNVLPIHVVDFHQRLQSKLVEIQDQFEQGAWTAVEGTGSHGVIAAGYASEKLGRVLSRSHRPPLRVLRLTGLHPLPEQRITRFLGQVKSALVVEEIAPYVEAQVQAIAQRNALTLPILGRYSGDLPRAGELNPGHLVKALATLFPLWDWPSFEAPQREMPSRKPLCPECPYIPTFETLLSVMEDHGGRDAFIVTGETGCMVRSQLPPWELLDVKYGMGASIGLAAGLARTGIPQRIVALSGDSALLHSGLGELIDAAQSGLSFLVIVLANGTTALSGGQPHPATHPDAGGQARPPVDLVKLVRASGVDSVRVVDPMDPDAVRGAFAEGIVGEGLSVVIAQHPCPMWT
jgi:indolepyruvate ferredoxin oxidoreductase alpha subunit